MHPLWSWGISTVELGHIHCVVWVDPQRAHARYMMFFSSVMDDLTQKIAITRCSIFEWQYSNHCNSHVREWQHCTYAVFLSV